MLQRNVNVRANFFMSCNDVKKPASDFVWVSVEETNPAQVFDGGQFLEQQRQPVLQPKILAVAGCVLADERDFTHARASEALGLCDYGLKAAGTKFTAYLRNNAETAWMIAALRDFDI